MCRKVFLCFLFLYICCSNMIAQTAVKDEYVFKQKLYPRDFDCVHVATFFVDKNSVYNLRGYPVVELGDSIVSMKVNPAGNNCAVLSSSKGKSKVSFYDLLNANNRIYRLKKGDTAALCYTPDAKTVLISDNHGLLYYDARDFFCYDSLEIPFKANNVVVSKNGYFVAATDGHQIGVWNLETKNQRLFVSFDSVVNAMDFSEDSRMFAILSSNGKLLTYDTRTYSLMNSYTGFGKALDFAFHPNSKYVSVVCNDSLIVLQNLMDSTERICINDTITGISKVRYVFNDGNHAFMVHNGVDVICYRYIDKLAPNYKRLLEDELLHRMNEWMKQMPGESEEEYNIRVNEDARLLQMSLFEQEISTRMADNLVSMSTVALNNYYPDSELLELNFDNMPSIFISVPSQEVEDFMDCGNLEFLNVKYGIMDNDRFELTYAEIHNKISGKVYIYDNLDGRYLALLEAEDDFIPIELIRQSNMEEIKLREIKENVVALAKHQNIISDHTNFHVNADVLSDYDADGNKITNYKVSFSYEVKKDFSLYEDFGPGMYKSSDSGAASSMLAIMKEALEGELATYVSKGNKLHVKITGMADAIPVNRTIPYDGCYGNFYNEPIYKDGVLGNVTVTKKSGIESNEQLAFLRAVGVKDYIQNNIKDIDLMDTDYEYNIEIVEGRGGEYRRIQVELVFISAFKN